MANDHIPRPDARFHARRSNFVPYVNGHLADLGLAAGQDGGKTAHYMLRWLSTRGEAAPPVLDGPPRTKSAVAQRRALTACQGWSETPSATIGA